MQLEVLQIFVTTLTLPMHAGIPKTGKSTPKSCNNHPKHRLVIPQRIPKILLIPSSSTSFMDIYNVLYYLSTNLLNFVILYQSDSFPEPS